jgi:uncharacterized BrkB/YihY/UPF0761 family membrane protein
VTALALFGFVQLAAFAVWETTEQRPGTRDELRTLAAVLVALLIVAGLSVLGVLPADPPPPDFNALQSIPTA